MGSRYDVFLCHNQADKPAVEELAERLRAAGLAPWLDSSDLRRGVQWTEEVEACLVEDSASCVVMIGPSGLGPWQKRELDLALDRHVEASRTNGSFPVIPVLLPGGKPDALPRFLKGHTYVSFPTTLDDQDAVADLVQAIRGLVPVRSQPSVSECPYRGLEFFDVAQAQYFCGRDALTDRLLEKLRSGGNSHVPSRFLAIVGASGSGKSSLARAGLVAALQRGKIEGSDQWPVVISRPGSDPCANLAVELAKTGRLGPDIQAVKDRLKDRMRQDPAALYESVQLILPSEDSKRRLVVLIDQFEELFTTCPDEKQRKAFIDNLLHASKKTQGQTIVLLAMRADFYGKCASYPQLALAVSECQVLVGPMTAEELREAIEKPAQKVGCELEPGLVDLLLREVADHPGSLPYLQFALKELWNKRVGRRLTTEAYRGIGGVTGALQKKADVVYARLSEPQQKICRQIFLRLTQPGEGTEDTKRRVPLSELEPKGGSMAEVESVLSNLSEAETRLVIGEAENGEEFVEVVHEELIRGWPQLRAWLDADRATVRMQRRLTEAAKQWRDNGREASYLFSGARLATAEEWAAAHAEAINSLEGEFIQASHRYARWQRTKLAAAMILAGLTVAVGYLGLADAELGVPGGAELRRELDHLGLSWLRPVVSDAQISKRASETKIRIRQHLTNSIVRKELVVDGPDASVWEIGQVAAAIYRDRTSSEKDLRLLPPVLDRTFKRKVVAGPLGKPIGWRDNGAHPRAETVLWLLMALGTALGRQDALSEAERGRYLNDLDVAENIAEAYYPLKDGGWNIVVEDKPQDHFVYSTTLALHALLELRSAELPWRGNRDRLTQMIEETSGWLVHTFVEKDNLTGWCRTSDDDKPPDQDLSLFAYGALGRAHVEANIALPPRIEAAAVKQLIELRHRSYHPAHQDIIHFSSGVGADGHAQEFISPTRILWYPWAVEALSAWMRYADEEKLPPEIKRAFSRSMAHLLVTLAPEMAEDILIARLFAEGETCYGLDCVR